jgi:hypothetical protein
LHPSSPLIPANPGHQALSEARAAGLGLEPLLAGWEPAGLARGEDAFAVGVAPAARIALWVHEHMLRQRRQMAAAQRAAVGRGLQVLGAADIPPPRLRALGHVSKDRIDWPR